MMQWSAPGSTTLLVEGGHALAGSIEVDGNKNAALPLLAACLLTDRPCRLTNVPRITDVSVMLELLQGLGAEVEGAGMEIPRLGPRGAARRTNRVR